MLWLLRHGEAVPHDSRASDADRELTPKGERQARNAGIALARLGVELEACYASPKVRAFDTARLAAAELGVDVVSDDAIASGFSRADAEALLAGHDGDVLIAGHEPDFSQVVHDFTGARVDFKKGGLACVKGNALIVLLRPTELIAMSGP